MSKDYKVDKYIIGYDKYVEEEGSVGVREVLCLKTMTYGFSINGGSVEIVDISKQDILEKFKYLLTKEQIKRL